jgi:Flp pilus assembly protein CpaB
MKAKSNKTVLLPDRRKIYLVFGVVLILSSMALIFQSLQKASARTTTVVVINDLPTGKIIEDSDLKIISVDLALATNKYYTEKNQLIGKSVLRNLYAGELIAISSIGERRDLRTVALKLSLGRVPPDLKVNDWVDIWWTDIDTNTSENLLKNINTSQVIQDGSGYASTITVVVAVPPHQVATLISAARTEAIDLVKHEN